MIRCTKFDGGQRNIYAKLAGRSRARRPALVGARAGREPGAGVRRPGGGNRVFRQPGSGAGTPDARGAALPVRPVCNGCMRCLRTASSARTLHIAMSAGVCAVNSWHRGVAGERGLDRVSPDREPGRRLAHLALPDGCAVPASGGGMSERADLRVVAPGARSVGVLGDAGRIGLRRAGGWASARNGTAGRSATGPVTGSASTAIWPGRRPGSGLRRGSLRKSGGRSRGRWNCHAGVTV